MSIARVQGVGNTETSQSTTLAIGSGQGWSASTGTNTIIVAVTARAVTAGGTFAVHDNTANVYTADVTNTTNAKGQAIFRCSNALSATTITLTWTPVSPDTVATLAMWAWEFSGVTNSSPLDQANTATASSSSAPTSTSITTANGSDVIVALLEWAGTATDSGPHTGGFTAETLQTSNVSTLVQQLLPAYRIVGATAAYAFGTTLSGAQVSGGAIASYKAASGSNEDSSLQGGFDIPGAATPQTFSATLSQTEQWVAGVMVYSAPSTSTPGTPTGVVASAGNALCQVTIGSLPSSGGATIDSYAVKVFNGATLKQTITGLSTLDPVGTGWTITGTGVANGTAVTFEVAAHNANGYGSYSSASAAVTPSTSSVPGTPAAPAVVATSGSAVVTVTPPSGSPTGYIFNLYLNDGQIVSQPQTGTSYTFTGLTDFIVYGFAVVATNANGPGVQSPPSYVVPAPTPSAPIPAPAAGPPTIQVIMGFQLRANLGPYFVLNDPIQGVLDNTSYTLAPPLAGIDVSAWLSGTIDVTSGRSREVDAFTAGQLTFTLRNEDRRFDPTNVLSPYYPGILPRTPVQIYANGYQLFGGYVDDYQIIYTQPNICEVTVTCHDAFALLSTATLIAYSAVQQLSSDRVLAVLARPEISFPAAASIGIGSLTMQASTQDNVLALDHLQSITASEGGALFCDRTGALDFLGQVGLVGQTFAPITFTDTGLAYYQTVVGYTGIQIMSAVLLLFNQVTGTRTGGTAQVADDTGSQVAYLVRNLTLPSLENNADSDVLALCQTYLSRYSQPEVRFASLTVELTSQSLAVQADLFSLDLIETLIAERTPPGGGLAITQLGTIEQIGWAFDVSASTYTLTLGLGNAQTETF